MKFKVGDIVRRKDGLEVADLPWQNHRLVVHDVLFHFGVEIISFDENRNSYYYANGFIKDLYRNEKLNRTL
jgi:hypothetical protein